MNISAEPELLRQTSGVTRQSQLIPGSARSTFEPFSRKAFEQSIPDRFERQVRIHSDRLAAKDQIGSSVTYAELNEAANRIGRAVLTAVGDGEKPVVIMIDQSVALLASILGTLKAGKFYVPVEPGYPHVRIRYVLSDMETPLLLTDKANHAAALDLADGKLQIINVDDIPNNISTNNIGLKLSPDRRAYIYYTSGTTGKPKGVVDCHRNVLHNVFRYTNKLMIGSDDRLSLVQSSGFSGAVSNIFCALLNGASIFPYDLHRDGMGNMAAWAEREELTMFHAVPAIFERLFSGSHEFPTLRVIRLEGDQAFKRHIDLFKDRLSARCTLVIGLGATETGIATQYVFNADDAFDGDIVPIGYPTEDMSVRLLDEGGLEVEQGDVGEIAVKSNYLSMGYWNRPDLAQSAFLTDPDSDFRRTYLTGDLGRARPDGCIEYVGRKGGQIKIRGQWIDVPRVEEIIRNLPCISGAAIAQQKDESGRDRLIAYIVLRYPVSINVTQLRSDLSGKLEGPSLPTAFVTLNELPLNENNKLDRSALPALTRHRPLLNKDYAAPQDTVERQMKKIWEDVLEVEPVGIHDDFFDLGGDSLCAATLFALVREVFGICLPPSAIYDEGATVARMAALIENPAVRLLDDPGMPKTDDADVTGHMPHREKSEPAPLVVKSDLVTTAALVGCAAIACLSSRAVQSALCRFIARVHIRLRGSRADNFKNVIPLLEERISARALEITLLAGEYEEVAETWRDYLPWSSPVKARLSGGEHLDAALSAGCGVVLWDCSSGPGSHVALRCLADAGLPVVALRSYAHPFSNSRLGMNVLNSVPNRIDNRHLESLVIVHEENTFEAMQALGAHLAANRVVQMSANGAFSKPYEIPFFGGTLCLALGAPTLAMLKGAPLVPVFCVPARSGGYDVIVEEPLAAGSIKTGAEASRVLAHQYTEILARHLKHHPQIWQNWFSRNTWRPGKHPDEG